MKKSHKPKIILLIISIIFLAFVVTVKYYNPFLKPVTLLEDNIYKQYNQNVFDGNKFYMYYWRFKYGSNSAGLKRDKDIGESISMYNYALTNYKKIDSNGSSNKFIALYLIPSEHTNLLFYFKSKKYKKYSNVKNDSVFYAFDTINKTITTGKVVRLVTVYGEPYYSVNVFEILDENGNDISKNNRQILYDETYKLSYVISRAVGRYEDEAFEDSNVYLKNKIKKES